MSDPEETPTVNHFTQGNAAGKLQDDLPALLRRVADSVEALGEVEIQDVVLQSALDGDACDRPFITVYCHEASK
jgi:hypothetical protein